MRHLPPLAPGGPFAGADQDLGYHGNGASDEDLTASTFDALRRSSDGDTAAGAELFRLLYDQLHQRARVALAHQGPAQTLCATDLVAECYLKIAERDADSYNNRDHFLRTASAAMRHVLIDHARAKQRIKRGGDLQRHGVDAIQLAIEDRAIDLLDLDEALEELGTFDPDMARAVELRFFGGANLEEAARAIGLTRRQLEGRWKTTRAWLYLRIR